MPAGCRQDYGYRDASAYRYLRTTLRSTGLLTQSSIELLIREVSTKQLGGSSLKPFSQSPWASASTLASASASASTSRLANVYARLSHMFSILELREGNERHGERTEERAHGSSLMSDTSSSPPALAHSTASPISISGCVT